MSAVRITAASNGAVPVPALAAAQAPANAVTVCPPTSARRALGAEYRSRSAQVAVGTLPWANISIQIASASTAAALSAIVAAVSSSSARSSAFPRTTAAWAPVWALAPATWVADYGTPFVLATPPAAYNSVSFSPMPAPPAPASLTISQATGLGLGIGLGLLLVLALALAAAIRACSGSCYAPLCCFGCCSRHQSVRAVNKLLVSPSSAK